MDNKELIRRIENMLAPSPDFNAILDGLSGLQIRVPTLVIPSGQLIARARCEMKPFQPAHKSEIAHISNPDYVSLGRASLPGVPTFYGSLFTVNHDKGVFYGLSILEATKLINNTDLSIICEYPVVGYWKTTEPLKTAVLIGRNQMRLLNQQLRNMFYDSRSRFDGDDPAYQALDYFSYEFCNDVEKGEDYRYAHTAALSYILHEDYDAIIYPSTKAEGDGVNIAIRIESANSMRLLQALAFLHTQDGEKDYWVTITGTGKCGDDGSISWEAVQQND